MTITQLPSNLERRDGVEGRHDRLIAGCRNHWPDATAVCSSSRVSLPSLFLPRILILGKGFVRPCSIVCSFDLSELRYSTGISGMHVLCRARHSASILSMPVPSRHQHPDVSSRPSVAQDFSVGPNPPLAVQRWVEADATVMGKLKAEWGHSGLANNGV